MVKVARCLFSCHFLTTFNICSNSWDSLVPEIRSCLKPIHNCQVKLDQILDSRKNKNQRTFVGDIIIFLQDIKENSDRLLVFEYYFLLENMFCIHLIFTPRFFCFVFILWNTLISTCFDKNFFLNEK